MRLRQSPARSTPTAALPVAIALASAVALTACGGQEGEQSEDPNAEAAAQLHDAQPLNVEDVTLLPESSEAGTYSELVTVQYSEEVRASTELDKPECTDAANRWSDLEAVREAPASVAAYEWDRGNVSHILVRLDEGSAAEALAVEPPETCAEYTATYEDGSSSDYGVADLDVPPVGDESRSFSIRVSDDGGENHMYTVMYRNGGLLGTTSVMGPGDAGDYEQMLVDFSEAAIKRQDQML
ncbi:hypothetical protein GCM10007079_06280 [Nocardiopsis terrae]|uniref:DUF5642 domain-containing protein n=1 Tax=Nocardiopsis terrae TaxID=372655 RepID=A0ABR9HNT0_9ACTN|nr:hypothetical protein [Nocardiopsis terrae]MBE1460675.1 hypothetical protein [Nocardiopsis terrae]GHC72822.1 hypothetical protein GCM10007079_06280 [Nocardiopsis terrae]